MVSDKQLECNCYELSLNEQVSGLDVCSGTTAISCVKSTQKFYESRLTWSGLDGRTRRGLPGFGGGESLTENNFSMSRLC